MRNVKSRFRKGTAVSSMNRAGAAKTRSRRRRTAAGSPGIRPMATAMPHVVHPTAGVRGPRRNASRMMPMVVTAPIENIGMRATASGQERSLNRR
jgi:hypothetical protein